MRRLLVLLSVVGAAACGGGSSGGGGGAPVPLTGTIGGRAFTVADVRAIPAGTGSTACSVPFGGSSIPVGIKAIALQFTSYMDGCGDYSGTTCTLHKDAQSVTVLYARLNATLSGTEPALVGYSLPHEFAIGSDPTTFTQETTGGIPNGYAWVAYAVGLATDASCVGTPPAVTGGKLVLTSVAGPVTGYVEVSFAGGDSLKGDFTAPLCTGTGPDVCQLAQAQTLCGSTVCQ